MRRRSKPRIEPTSERCCRVGVCAAHSGVHGDELDQRIRQHHAEGDCDAAATLIVRGYGGWVNGFLASRMRSPVAVDEVYSLFCEQLWRGLPSVH